MKVDFFFPQIAQCDKSINLSCLVFLTLEFSFAVFFLQLRQYISIVTYNQAIFFNNKFHSFKLHSFEMNQLVLLELIFLLLKWHRIV